MITTAHIGVGIKGEEGVQAVNASDYALAQFEFLGPLLLKHGRYNYVRMSNVVAYMFYKNILLSLTMFWYAFFNAFSESKWVSEGAIQFFNVFYTSLPIIFYGMYDRDIDYKLVLKYPQIYMDGIRNELFNQKTFSLWVWDSVLESVLLTVFPLYLLTNFDEHGTMSTMFEPGHLCMTAVVIVVNLKINTIQHDIYWFTILLQVGSVLSWLIIAVLINKLTYIDLPASDFYGIWDRLVTNGTFWLALFLLLTIYVTKEMIVHTIKRMYFSKNRYVLQDMKEPNDCMLGCSCAIDLNEDEAQSFKTTGIGGSAGARLSANNLHGVMVDGGGSSTNSSMNSVNTKLAATQILLRRTLQDVEEGSVRSGGSVSVRLGINGGGGGEMGYEMVPSTAPETPVKAEELEPLAPK